MACPKPATESAKLSRHQAISPRVGVNYEIQKLLETTRERGLTVVPIKLYLKNGLIKVEFAVGRGKKLHDKRESERAREMKEEARAALSRRKYHPQQETGI